METRIGDFFVYGYAHYQYVSGTHTFIPEQWKDIKGYEGIYQVANTGRVRSLDRTRRGCSDCVTKIKGRTLKPSFNGAGYLFVNLSCKNITSLKMIHRLVALTFLPNPSCKREVNHVNGVKTDNKLANLAWSTPSENILHALRLGLMNTAKGSQKKSSKFTENQVAEIKRRLIKGEIGSHIAKEFGVHKGLIYAIKSGKTWKHVLA